MRPGAASIGILAVLLPLALSAAEKEGKAPVKLSEFPLDSGNLVSTALGLVLVLALIVGLAWLLRRFGHLPTANKGMVRILGGVSLGPRERAVLLSVGQTRLLVGVAPGRVQALHVLSEEDSELVAEATGEGFDRRLSNAIKEQQS